MVKKQNTEYIKYEPSQEYFSEESEGLDQQQMRQFSRGKSTIKRKQNYDSDSYDDESQSERQQNQSLAYDQFDDDVDSEAIEQQVNKLEQQQQRIKQMLKELPYSVIIKQKKDLEEKKNNISQQIKKHRRKKLLGGKSGGQQNQVKDKNAPKQLPIYKKPPKMRNQVIFGPKRPKSIDPRFEDYAGNYNPQLAMKSYDFVSKIQQREIQTLKNTLQKGKASLNNTKPGKRRHKKTHILSEKQKQSLTKQYNRLTNQKRRLQLSSLEKQVKKTLQKGSRTGIINKKQFREQFQKAKLGRMSEEDRKKYFTKKQKKIIKNQQVQRNRLMFQTSGFKNKKN